MVESLVVVCYRELIRRGTDVAVQVFSFPLGVEIASRPVWSAHLLLRLGAKLARQRAHLNMRRFSPSLLVGGANRLYRSSMCPHCAIRRQTHQRRSGGHRIVLANVCNLLFRDERPLVSVFGASKSGLKHWPAIVRHSLLVWLLFLAVHARPVGAGLVGGFDPGAVARNHSASDLDVLLAVFIVRLQKILLAQIRRAQGGALRVGRGPGSRAWKRGCAERRAAASQGGPRDRVRKFNCIPVGVVSQQFQSGDRHWSDSKRRRERLCLEPPFHVLQPRVAPHRLGPTRWRGPVRTCLGPTFRATRCDSARLDIRALLQHGGLRLLGPFDVGHLQYRARHRAGGRGVPFLLRPGPLRGASVVVDVGDCRI
mmetsp:Transcript_33453/g.101000  ORF Transcript_33453/g.101000 Transcript_33453/m.101000 type:complete len:368 (-) Transcript_33453:146-1249(-)